MSATGNRTAGFTLIEALVVLALVGIASGIAYPQIERMVQLQRFREAGHMAEALVRETRARAIARARTEVLQLGGGEEALAAGDRKGDLPRFPDGVDVEQEPRAIRFFSDGSSDGGAIAVRSGGRELLIRVVRPTGRLDVD